MRKGFFARLLPLVFLSVLSVSCGLWYPPEFYESIISGGNNGNASEASWTKYSPNANDGFYFSCVAFTNDQSLFIGTADGYMYQSIDGGKTLNFEYLASGMIHSMIYESDTLVVSTENGIYTYQDGTWTVSSGTSGYAWHQVLYTNGYYVAVGCNSSSSVSIVFYTQDLTVTWASSETSGTNLFDICYFGNSFYAVGIEGDGVPTLYCAPADNPASWSMVGELPGLCSNIAGSPDVLVAAGTNGLICYSYDGSNWAMKWPTDQNFNQVIWLSDMKSFLAVGDNGTMLLSPDFGYSWVDAGIGFESGENLLDAAYNGTRFAIVTSLTNLYVSP